MSQPVNTGGTVSNLSTCSCEGAALPTSDLLFTAGRSPSPHADMNTSTATTPLCFLLLMAPPRDVLHEIIADQSCPSRTGSSLEGAAHEASCCPGGKVAHHREFNQARKAASYEHSRKSRASRRSRAAVLLLANTCLDGKLNERPILGSRKGSGKVRLWVFRLGPRE